VGLMFQHVIVPFDGTLEARAALAPAADLAWRCGAKVVIVSTTGVEDEVVHFVLKSQAIAKSGSDIDFWIDPELELGDAVLEATKFRADPIICMASRYRGAGLVRKRHTAAPLPEAVLRHSMVPIVVIGPEMDLTRGLPLAELVMPIDDSPESVRSARLAAEMATALRIGVRFLVIVPPEVGDPRPPEAVREIFDEIRARLPAISLEVIETERPAAALVAIADEQRDAVILLPRTGGDERGPFDSFTAEVVATSHLAVVLAPPGV
jgi:nucleotide-binding universal stress UspA family protein